VRRGADGLGRGCSEPPSKRQTDMAPQVLRNVRPEITAFQLGAVLKDRPLLASLVAQIIEQWAWIDAVINGMLADFLRLDIVIATKMLQAVENQSAGTAMARAALKQALTARRSPGERRGLGGQDVRGDDTGGEDHLIPDRNVGARHGFETHTRHIDPSGLAGEILKNQLHGLVGRRGRVQHVDRLTTH
jgi:hypothetical protein